MSQTRFNMSVDVVIIGAGIQGLSAAYNLALGGDLRILVLGDRRNTHSASAGTWDTMLLKSSASAQLTYMSLYSWDRFMAFADEFGEELRFRKMGLLTLVTPGLAEHYEKEHALRLAMGVPSQRLSPPEVSKLIPGLFVGDLAFGILGTDAGEIHPEQILAAYERRGREMGVTYDFGERATSILTAADRVVGVQTTSQTISCGHVINAAGAQAGDVAAWVGVELPLESRSQLTYMIECRDDTFQDGPMLNDAEAGWTCRAQSAGKLLLGVEPGLTAVTGARADQDSTREVRDLTAHRIPALAEQQFAGGDSVSWQLTPDGLPIVGPVADISGLINLCGWGGEGIMLSPAGGSLVADMINDTWTCSINPAPLLASRFNATALNPSTGSRTGAAAPLPHNLRSHSKLHLR